MDKKKIAKIVEAMNNTIHDIATTDDQKIEKTQRPINRVVCGT